MFVYSSLVESRCPCRDVGEAILVASLRPIRTARETLGDCTLERPSCGGVIPTAETTLFPAYSAIEKIWLWPWATSPGFRNESLSRNIKATGPVEGADAVGRILGRFWVAVLNSCKKGRGRRRQR